MSDDELRQKYDELALRVSEGLEWYREEIWRRRGRKQTTVLIWLTVTIGILTAANVVLVAVATS
jgi:hypothetical protein